MVFITATKASYTYTGTHQHAVGAEDSRL